jgi:hypothetical protein
MDKEIQIVKTKWFAWYPVKTNDGWVWLEYVWHEKRIKTKLIVRCLIEPDFLKSLIQRNTNG